MAWLWLRLDNVTLFQLTCESNPGMIFHLKSSVYQKAGGFIHINRKRAKRRPLNYKGSVENSLLDILSTYLVPLFDSRTFILMRISQGFTILEFLYNLSEVLWSPMKSDEVRGIPRSPMKSDKIRWNPMKSNKVRWSPINS